MILCDELPYNRVNSGNKSPRFKLELYSHIDEYIQCSIARLNGKLLAATAHVHSFVQKVRVQSPEQTISTP